MKKAYKAVIEYQKNYTFKEKIISGVLSMLFTLFFISAPLLLFLNMMLFYDYIYLFSLGLVGVFCLLFYLFFKIYFLILAHIKKQVINLKPFYAWNLLFSFIFGMIIYSIVMFFVYLEV